MVKPPIRSLPLPVQVPTAFTVIGRRKRPKMPVACRPKRVRK